MRLEKLCPVFGVRDVPASVAFYERLGFRTVYLSPPHDYALLKRDAAELHLRRADDPAPQTAFMRPDGIDAFDAEVAALNLPAAGAPARVPARNMPWGMREMTVTDPDGNVIRASQEIPGSPSPNALST